MRQQTWLDQLKYYEIDILYHPSKENVIVDALSHKIMANTYGKFVVKQVITKDLFQLEILGVNLLESPHEEVIMQNAAESSLVVEVEKS